LYYRAYNYEAGSSSWKEGALKAAAAVGGTLPWADEGSSPSKGSGSGSEEGDKDEADAEGDDVEPNHDVDLKRKRVGSKSNVKGLAKAKTGAAAAVVKGGRPRAGRVKRGSSEAAAVAAVGVGSFRGKRGRCGGATGEVASGRAGMKVKKEDAPAAVVDALGDCTNTRRGGQKVRGCWESVRSAYASISVGHPLYPKPGTSFVEMQEH
jgi:hypothetical protein